MKKKSNNSLLGFEKFSKDIKSQEKTMKKIIANPTIDSSYVTLKNYIDQQQKQIDSLHAATCASDSFIKFDQKARREKSQIKALSYILDCYQDSISVYKDSNDEEFLKIIDTNIETKVKNASNLAIVKSLLHEITSDECFEFINHLSEKPYLAYKHETGKSIYNFISTQKEETTNAVEVYRIRINNDGKKIPYVPNQMFEPMYGTTGQSRFSPLGHNYLYLCNDLETAKKETGVTENSIYTFIKLRFKNNYKLLDITNKCIPIFDLCHNIPTEDTALKTEYLMPNYISNCAKDLGFEGILYSSTHNPEANNYVVFGAGKQNFDHIKIGHVGYIEE